MLAKSCYGRNLYIVIVALFISACSTKADKNKKHQAELFFGAGTQSLMTQDYTDALTNLLRANELDPQNDSILNNLGMAYYFKGEKDMAIQTLKKSLEIKEGNSDAKLNLASIYFNEGNLEEAEKLYLSVLKNLIYDKQARTLYNLGILEIKRRNSNKAYHYFNKSVSEDPNYCPSYYQLGLIHYERKEFSLALKNFKEATMGTCYESPAAHYYQGLTFSHLKRYNEARLKFDEVDTRFGKSEFASMARAKMMELNDITHIEMNQETQAKKRVLESPDF